MQQAVLSMHYVKEILVNRRIFNNFTITMLSVINKDGNRVEIELFSENSDQFPAFVEKPTQDVRIEDANVSA